MAWVRNDSGRDLRGPYHILQPGEVAEVPDRWLRRRNDRVRRGQLAIVGEPADNNEYNLVDLGEEE